MWNGLFFLWTLRGPQPQELDPAAVFAEAPLQATRVVADVPALARVAAATLRYRQTVADPKGVQAGILGEAGVDQIDATLAFVVRIAAEDAGKAAQRLLDPAFLAEHLQLWAWDPPGEATTLRLTRYGVWQMEGRTSPEGAHRHALYATPADEDLRRRYARQDLLGGVYEAGGAAAGQAMPLVYLTERAFLEANLQGTIEITVPGQAPALYNVDRSNELPYVRGAAPLAQRRVWYFRKVDGVYGWGPEPAERVRIEGGATVAGDVANLGLGRLVALRVPTAGGALLRLAVLADTGGAFDGNLGQLDWFGGIFPNSAGLYAATADLPQRVPAGLLTLRAP
jgi:hypothetical protein